MTAKPPSLSELPESRATGKIAEIYEEIRVYCGVPYVSSMQRHLATRPGVLEWAWAAVRPALASGRIPETAWRLAGQVQVQSLPPLTRSALRLLGVAEADEASIRTICETFIRVSPINLLLGGIWRRLLEGAQPLENMNPNIPPWTPPPGLSAGPTMLNAAELPLDHREVLRQFETDIGTSVFVPGLYRMLAHWPAYLAHVATVLGPRFADADTKRACDALAVRIDAAAPDVLAALPPLPSNRPKPEEAAEIVTAILRYRVTSPQMVIFATLLRDALPR